MRDAGVDDDRVDGLFGSKSEAVGGNDLRLWPSAGEVRARPLGESRINLDRRHAPTRSDEFGEDGAVVAQTGADMDHVVAAREAELVEERRPQARLPIVEPTLLVDGHQHIVTQAARIGVVGGPVVGTADWA